MPDDNPAGLDPRSQQILKYLRANVDKGNSVMDIYVGTYSEEEQNAHLKDSGGPREAFREVQRHLDELRAQGQVTLKIVGSNILYNAAV